MKFLSTIERIGNRLPDPNTLFFIGTVLIFIVSYIASMLQWTAISPTGEKLIASNLLSSNGIWWLLSTMVDNFMQFPPLGIVLVGMLGIGFAEKTGLLAAVIRTSMKHVSMRLLTPATLFIGIMSSLALDAGYVVLVPLAALIYLSVGRSPLLGIAVSFAGVSAGFSANLFITALDPLLAGFTQSAANFIDPEYQVAITGNWWFMIASTFLLTATGWSVTERFVEPAIADIDIIESQEEDNQNNSEIESKALKYAAASVVIVASLIFLSISLTGWPLHGKGDYFDRWIEATVPLLLILFFLPGLVFGICSKSIQSDRDVATILGKVMAQLGPYIVLAFFAAQFIAAFNESGLGQILAVTGGNLLRDLNVGDSYLLICFVLMVVLINLLIGSASAKYAFFAPVFVPMLMQVNISPELTQAAYRIGDSVSNIITPMNPYMIIIIMEVRKYVKGSGLGTVVAMMLPYTIAFTLVWLALLVLWIELSIPIGPGASLKYQY
ncbi:MAG: AbgT family transporter [Pseudomonadota bacterium]